MNVQKNSEDAANYEWAIGLNRAALTFLGVWPEIGETRQKKIMMDIKVIFLLNVAIWSCAIPCVHSLFKVWDDIIAMIDNLQYTLPFLISLLKLVIMWQKKEDLLPLLNMIKEDWMKLKTTEERDVMIKNARIARTLSILGLFIMLLSFILVIILPTFGISIRYVTNMTDTNKLMPFQTYYPYDRDKSPFYEITYSLQGVSSVICAIMYTGIDNFLGLLVFHVCGQLENLKARIINLDKVNNFERALLFNVLDHRRLIKSINTIDDTFTLMLFGALFYFGVLFALYGFLITIMITQGRDVSVARLIFIVTIFINTFAHTCLYCAVGEILVEQCTGVYQATCEYKWYMLKPKRSRDLLFIMIRASKPSYLTAGKLFPMTMATFCNLLKTSGGYISVLLAQRD